MKGDKPVRILNVDDRDIPRYVHEETLRREGFEVISVANGGGALAAARDGIDVVILDVQMPDMDGFEVCRRLKADPGTCHVIVLMTSATFVTARDRITGLDSGADGYLAQPYETSELKATLRSLLRARTAERHAHALAGELHRAMEVRDEFVAMLGHELRNPLSTITAALHMLEYRRNPKDLERYLAILNRQTTSLTRIVDDLLDVARITRGKVALQCEVIDLREIVEQYVQESAADETRGSDHVVELDAPANPVLVFGDKVRLGQVISNLVTNALKYTPAGGCVWLRVSSEGGNARLEVSDNGIGMDASLRDHVFDVFVQGKESVDRARGGLGLGLTVVRQLVELHGGTVAAFSDGAGAGSRFVVDLPLSAQRVAVAAPTKGSVAVFSALRIVLVEDDEDARDCLKEALSDLGHYVQVASDGLAGLELLLETRPDVALVDIGLPWLDGYEVARQLRGRCVGAMPRLIAMTGYGQSEDRARAQSAGFDLHIVKPVKIGALKKILVTVAAEQRKAATLVVEGIVV